jgi:tRNA G18 (ribose-2'-O)-methylase SpoU
MPVLRLEGADDPRVAAYHGVADPILLRSHGLFMAEGRLVVERLLSAGRYHVRSLLLSAAAHRALEPVLTALAPAVPVYLCDADDFLRIAGFDVHRGCLALVERPSLAPFGDLVADARLVVVLEGVANADNVGGVFRNVAAFGGDAVLLSPTSCDPLYRKAIRTSMAATLRIPFARFERWPDDLFTLRNSGLAVVALTPRGGSATLDEFVASGPPARVALLVGAEGGGLSEAAERAADYHVRIPVRPDVDSLNLAVATGIALSRLSRNAAF